MSRSKAKKALKGFVPTKFVPLQGEAPPLLIRPSASGPEDVWLLRAAKHIAHASTLMKHGWRKHSAFKKALTEAKRALSCALFWKPGSASVVALVKKIDRELAEFAA
jgi:hypothetical protein